jgi:hypothetical protein
LTVAELVQAAQLASQRGKTAVVVRLAKELQKLQPGESLLLAGHCPDSATVYLRAALAAWAFDGSGSNLDEQWAVLHDREDDVETAKLETQQLIVRIAGMAQNRR